MTSDVLWFGMKIEHAIDTKRLHHQLLPPYIEFENDFNEVSAATVSNFYCIEGAGHSSEVERSLMV